MNKNVKVKQTSPKVQSLSSLTKKFKGESSKPTMVYDAVPDKYERRYKRLKKIVKHYLFVNGAICDDVIRIEEKTHRVKEERRVLLKRLLKQQEQTDSQSQHGKSGAPGPNKTNSPSIAQILGEIEKKGRRRNPSQSQSKQKVNKLTNEETPSTSASTTTTSSRPKGSKKSKINSKRLVQPIALDNNGRPLLPIELGNLTVYCLGELTPEKKGFHTPDHIYPLGFYSTRTYASLVQPTKQALYNCKILDGGNGPKFEISAEEHPSYIFVGLTASDCHNKLLQTLNGVLGYDAVQLGEKGPDFFGFSHPTIHNLLQGLPGSRKFPQYKWTKFEVNKDGLYYVETDPAFSYSHLLETIGKKSSGKDSKDKEDKKTHMSMFNITNGQLDSTSKPSLSKLLTAPERTKKS